MPTRQTTTARTVAREPIETHAGNVFGREWWGFDRDGLEDELARQEAGRARERAVAAATEGKAH